VIVSQMSVSDWLDMAITTHVHLRVSEWLSPEELPQEYPTHARAAG
jgi:hypothetical protein